MADDPSEIDVPMDAQQEEATEALVEEHDESELNVFEITDFTCATSWERLIATIEEKLRAWGLAEGRMSLAALRKMSESRETPGYVEAKLDRTAFGRSVGVRKSHGFASKLVLRLYFPSKNHDFPKIRGHHKEARGGVSGGSLGNFDWSGASTVSEILERPQGVW